jgi:hypothetical protein
MRSEESEIAVGNFIDRWSELSIRDRESSIESSIHSDIFRLYDQYLQLFVIMLCRSGRAPVTEPDFSRLPPRHRR